MSRTLDLTRELVEQALQLKEQPVCCTVLTDV